MEGTKILVSANIGLGDSKIDPNDYVKNTTVNGRTNTFARVHDCLAKIYNTYGQTPDIFSVQELGFLGFIPRPFFEKATATDAKVLANLNNTGRGVGIYAKNNEAFPIITSNIDDEVTAIIDSYPDRKNKKSLILQLLTCIVVSIKITPELSMKLLQQSTKLPESSDMTMMYGK